MIHSAMIYAKILTELQVGKDDIKKATELLENRELMEALCNPSILKTQKHRVIDRLFPTAICNFIKIMCDENILESWAQVLQSYDELEKKQKQILTATLLYLEKPEEDQIRKIKKMLYQKYNKSDIQLELHEDPSLLGGFVLTAGDMVWDKSVKTSLKRLHDHLIER